MAALTRWDPFTGFDRMLDMFYRSGGEQRRTMPIDIYRNGDEYVVEMELPGVDPSSIDVNVESNMLTVSAEARSNPEQAEEQVVCERSHSRFFRQLYLGNNADLDNVKASYDNGVLRLSVPVRTRSEGRKVEVTSQGGGPQSIGSAAHNGGESATASTR